METKQFKNLNVEDFFSYVGYEPEDSFVRIQDLKQGDIVYECVRGNNIEFQVLSDPKEKENGWMCKIKNRNGEQFDIYVSGGTKPEYQPMFYKDPQALYILEES